MVVWVCQCVCPQRHCILAAAVEWDDEGEAATREHARIAAGALKDRLMELTKDGGSFDPWCGSCGAPQRQWKFETMRTQCETMEEARDAVRAATELGAKMPGVGAAPRTRH